MTLSNRIRMLREKFLLTQEDFAKEIGVAASTVNRWETGKVRPNLSAMRAIRDFCINKNYSYDDIENSWLNHL